MIPIIDELGCDKKTATSLYRSLGTHVEDHRLQCSKLH